MFIICIQKQPQKVSLWLFSSFAPFTNANGNANANGNYFSIYSVPEFTIIHFNISLYPSNMLEIHDVYGKIYKKVSLFD